MYEYLIWVGLLGVIWAFIYFLNPELRKKILWSSLIALPFGLGELYYIPNYWTPQTLFDLGMKYSIDLESFALMFFLGGIAAFTYESIFKKKRVIKQKLCGTICKCYIPFTSTLIAFIVLSKLLINWNIIYPTSFALLIGGIVAMLMYPGLRKHIIVGGIIFALLYLISLAIVDFIFPGWIANAWNMSILSGITILKVPIEEIFFGFSFGTLWVALFEEACSSLDMKKKRR